MLAELVVSDLGVIEHLSLTVGTGMTAFTGETGAGKTLIVEAIELLLGGRADPLLVRAGAEEARVDGRFVIDDEECVLSRVLPVNGRSRAYIDGRPVPVGVLAEKGRSLLDLHGQHAHQTLLSPAAQREALDVFGGIDHGPMTAAKERLKDILQRLRDLGGDERSRAREIDLLRFQLDELTAARIEDPNEDEKLEAEEELLGDALAHREAANTAVDALSEDSGARDTLGVAIASLAGRAPFSGFHARLRALQSDLDDLTNELRRQAETMESDPERLAEIRQRRQRLRELCRKYGDDLASVLKFEHETAMRLEELMSHDESAAQLDRDRTAVEAQILVEAKRIAVARTKASGPLVKEIELRLHSLAMPKARIEILVTNEIDESDSDDQLVEPRPGSKEGPVQFLLAANAGQPALPLNKVASGGELARIMLAMRLALLESPASKAPGRGPASRPVSLVFDEVDAGIGGQAAVAVGRALAALGDGRQVFVVTHLPQVAACADNQVLVKKQEVKGRTVTSVATLDHHGRVSELARMLAGQPDSVTAREHAEELLAGRPRAATSKATASPVSIVDPASSPSAAKSSAKAPRNLHG